MENLTKQQAQEILKGYERLEKIVDPKLIDHIYEILPENFRISMNVSTIVKLKSIRRFVIIHNRSLIEKANEEIENPTDLLTPDDTKEKTKVSVKKTKINKPAKKNQTKKTNVRNKKA